MALRNAGPGSGRVSMWLVIVVLGVDGVAGVAGAAGHRLLL